MAVRYILHLSKVEEFARWAEGLEHPGGHVFKYSREETKGQYEVLRLRKAGEPPLIYHKRLTGDHATFPDTGPAGKLVRKWLSNRQKKGSN